MKERHAYTIWAEYQISFRFEKKTTKRILVYKTIKISRIQMLSDTNCNSRVSSTVRQQTCELAVSVACTFLLRKRKVNWTLSCITKAKIASNPRVLCTYTYYYYICIFSVRVIYIYVEPILWASKWMNNQIDL